ncbi:Dps family protein [Salinispora cortesiana]|uniref:Dps family protein n=1 Tax=Salinispora cortesiana TaxID=1305843 RepID=UPI00040C6A11|nr:DNA starvation/stationary phase protection protein [Salinispora cortesiana]
MSTTTAPTVAPTPTPDSAGVILQQTLSDLLDLAFQAKQAHWNVTGPRFLPLHQQLDTLADTACEHADSIAERVAAIGTPPDARATTIAATSRLPQLDTGALPDGTVIDKIGDLLTTTAAGIRHAIEATADDSITQDLLITTGHAIEHQAWLLRSQR